MFRLYTLKVPIRSLYGVLGGLKFLVERGAGIKLLLYLRDQVVEVLGVGRGECSVIRNDTLEDFLRVKVCTVGIPTYIFYKPCTFA